MKIVEKIKKLMPEAVIYPCSLSEVAEGQGLMLRFRDKDLLLVSGSLCNRFVGEVLEDLCLCELTGENRKSLNTAFAHTFPQAFGSNCATFGFGDRFGYANPVQLMSLKGLNILPVLAQQSMRELSLTGRTYEQVIDTASWAIFRQGWKSGFAADGDHLKTVEEVKTALKSGCSMITLDCSGAMNNLPMSQSKRTYDQMDYIQNKKVKELGLKFDAVLLEDLNQMYSAALQFIIDVVELAIRPAGRTIDLEISLDETNNVTSPEAHYYVVNELARVDIKPTNLAPRFVGEFQKAIDYIGNPEEFRIQLRCHSQIADYFGHKLSLHSASEKFAIFPAMSQETKGRYHVKTSGTSWLEIVKCIAKKDAGLYRAMHEKALDNLEDAKKIYDVDCEISRIKHPNLFQDDKLPTLLEDTEKDTRQLMHITYGFILEDSTLHGRIYDFMEKYRDFYESEALKLYKMHTAALTN